MQTPLGEAANREVRHKRIDVRRRAAAITAVATLLLGALLAWPPQRSNGPAGTPLRFADILRLPANRGTTAIARMEEVKARFEQGVTMLRMRQYEYALTAFHHVLTLAPELPEAHVNMGFALIGLEQWKNARDFFASAIELRRDQINAYYGLAIALEAMGDIPGAMGAMQAYLHRAPATDPFRARADSTLQTWRLAQQAPAAERK